VNLSPFRITWELVRLSTKAAVALVQSVMGWVEQAPVRRGARAARRGVLGPDDPPPPPDLLAGTFDYRGLARARELAPAAGAYRLGRLRRPDHGWKLLDEELGLSQQDIVRHAIVVGPVGAGKTDSFVIPWIYGALAGGRSVLAVDVRGDLWPALRHYGAGRGQLNAKVYRWDHRDPGASSSWRWIDELDSEETIEAAAEAILGRERPTEPAPTHRRDMRILTALLALSRQLPAPSAASMLDALGDRQRLAALLARFPQSAATSDLRWLVSLEGSEFAAAVGNVVDGLRPLASSEVRRISETPGFSLKLLADEPALLIVGLPASGAQTAETMVGLSVALTAQRWLRGSTRPNVPALLMLSEAPRIQRRVCLPLLLSQGPSVGLAVVLTAQSLTQFWEEEQDATTSNCATMIVLPGTSPSSTEHFAKRLGQRNALALSSGVQRRRPWDAPQHELNASNQTVPMLGHREVSMPPFEGRPALVHAATLHPQPFLVDVTREDL
jgi:type IV secretory pathway TraG/TraD family ATPase VirD4